MVSRIQAVFFAADQHMHMVGFMQIQVGQHTFTYDNVYGSGGGVDAVDLYPDCVQPLVEGLFKGYNATVFAYGECN